MDIELCIYYNIVTIWFLFIIQSINLLPNAHTITSSAHCSTLQPSAAYSQTSSAHPVHILQQPLHLQCTLQPCTEMYSYLQPIFSAHCSQLQPSTTTYTTAIPFSAHCSYTIYHTVHLVKKGKPIPSLAYLQSSP